MITATPLGGEMPMDVIEQLDVILPQVEATAGRIPLSDFDNDTPCAAYKVRDLFDHMIGGASQFAPQLRGEEPKAFDPATLADGERHVALKEALHELQAAAKAPGALGRTVRLPFGEVPGEVLARFLTVDGMVHTWDLAAATGQRYDPPASLATDVLATAESLIAPEMRDGDTFAAAVPVGDDAPAVERLAAFTGRDVGRWG
jgi:uncharacterized protein (TIGR03086 family)